MKSADYIQISADLITNATAAGITNGKVIMLCAKLEAMCKKTGQCQVTNTYLADLLKVEERTVQMYLSELKAKGFIKSFDKKIQQRQSLRTIYWQR